MRGKYQHRFGGGHPVTSIRRPARDEVGDHGRGRSRTGARRNDQLLRARRDEVAGRVHPRDARAALGVSDHEAVGIDGGQVVEKGDRRIPDGPDEPAVDGHRGSVDQPHRRDLAPMAVKPGDRRAHDADSAGVELGLVIRVSPPTPFVKTVSSVVQRDRWTARAARSAVSPIRASGRSRSSQPSQATQLKTLIP